MQSVYFTAPTNLAIGFSLEEELPLCRDAVGVFYSPNQLDHRTLFGGSLSSLQRCSRCILQPQPTWPQDTLWGKSLLSAEMQSVYFTAPTNLTTGHSLGEVLALCRDAVGVFYSPNQLDHRTLFGGSLSSLQRCSRCILQPQPTWPQDTLWGKS